MSNFQAVFFRIADFILVQPNSHDGKYRLKNDTTQSLYKILGIRDFYKIISKPLNRLFGNYCIFNKICLLNDNL